MGLLPIDALRDVEELIVINLLDGWRPEMLLVAGFRCRLMLGVLGHFGAVCFIGLLPIVLICISFLLGAFLGVTRPAVDNKLRIRVQLFNV